ncbi:branched-subunit amino acid transport protein [Lysinibacillus composti]|uniref:AzlD domain-containing protein n=1 Tax=Lysinibacillus composti TaxID=720633 RepID=A0A3N9USB2_9BACI|nr:AzlD domain-containing protein [Lysinibacillus composti]MBM7607939.1 branched-subunit amino acid transport protein [Lysinibacillus composti]RQW75402.1 AzlD domain-containing protein [Lysinibacillus composti]
MTTTVAMVLIILGCALVTWLPRIFPFMLVRNVKLPNIVLRWLAYIPVCILSALVIESLINSEGKFVTLNWVNVCAFIPTLLVAIKTKSLSITVVIGVVTMAIIRNFT